MNKALEHLQSLAIYKKLSPIGTEREIAERICKHDGQREPKNSPFNHVTKTSLVVINLEDLGPISRHVKPRKNHDEILGIVIRTKKNKLMLVDGRHRVKNAIQQNKQEGIFILFE